LPRVVCDSHRGVIYEFAMHRFTSMRPKKAEMTPPLGGE
jgi:hypothetical protein